MTNSSKKLSLSIISSYNPNTICIDTSGEDFFKTGEEYYSHKDYTKALNHYTEAAEQHDHLNSQYALRVMYILGEGVVR